LYNISAKFQFIANPTSGAVNLIYDTASLVGSTGIQQYYNLPDKQKRYSA